MLQLVRIAHMEHVYCILYSQWSVEVQGQNIIKKIGVANGCPGHTAAFIAPLMRFLLLLMHDRMCHFGLRLCLHLFFASCTFHTNKQNKTQEQICRGKGLVKTILLLNSRNLLCLHKKFYGRKDTGKSDIQRWVPHLKIGWRSSS